MDFKTAAPKMSENQNAIIVRPQDRAIEGWSNPARGSVTWRTFISGDITASSHMSAGLAELEPHHGELVPHRHAQAEIYHIIEGTGILTLEDVEHSVSAGTCIYIPGDAKHGIRNESDSVLRLFYVFPTDKFSDVVYRF